MYIKSIEKTGGPNILCGLVWSPRYLTSQHPAVLKPRRKIKGAKKYCSSRPEFTRQGQHRYHPMAHKRMIKYVLGCLPHSLSRKSDYGEGTLYWVLVSEKGQRKTLAFKRCTCVSGKTKYVLIRFYDVLCTACRMVSLEVPHLSYQAPAWTESFLF